MSSGQVSVFHYPYCAVESQLFRLGDLCVSHEDRLSGHHDGPCHRLDSFASGDPASAFYLRLCRPLSVSGGDHGYRHHPGVGHSRRSDGLQTYLVFGTHRDPDRLGLDGRVARRDIDAVKGDLLAYMETTT